MEIAVESVRKSHKMLMNTTFSQFNAPGISRSNNFP